MQLIGVGCPNSLLLTLFFFLPYEIARKQRDMLYPPLQKRLFVASSWRETVWPGQMTLVGFQFGPTIRPEPRLGVFFITFFSLAYTRRRDEMKCFFNLQLMHATVLPVSIQLIFKIRTRHKQRHRLFFTFRLIERG
ncbi:hypothetical protein ABW19_dt0207524 [Dactylella cylindrospora]|nr:hypothetical protein ABW19_dt0207524 [Dactylella cylindrospora]